MPIYQLDQKKLFNTVVEEANHLLLDLLKTYGKNELYVISLCTDNDVTSVYPKANTLSALNELYTKNKKAVNYYPSENDFRNYYKWYPNEWLISIGEKFQFEKTTNLIYLDDEINETDDEFLRRKKTTILTIVKALARSRNIVFGEDSDLACFLGTCMKTGSTQRVFYYFMHVS